MLLLCPLSDNLKGFNLANVVRFETWAETVLQTELRSRIFRAVREGSSRQRRAGETEGEGAAQHTCVQFVYNAWSLQVTRH